MLVPRRDEGQPTCSTRLCGAVRSAHRIGACARAEGLCRSRRRDAMMRGHRAWSSRTCTGAEPKDPADQLVRGVVGPCPDSGVRLAYRTAHRPPTRSGGSLGVVWHFFVDTRAIARIILTNHMTPSIRAFVHGVRDPEVAAGALDVIDQLSTDPSLDAYRASLRSVAREGRSYWDLACTLSYLAECFPLSDYLEIRVRRGKSMAQVAARRPECRIVGCDMWMSPYGGVDNPGPDFVQEEMARLGHRG